MIFRIPAQLQVILELHQLKRVMVINQGCYKEGVIRLLGIRYHGYGAYKLIGFDQRVYTFSANEQEMQLLYISNLEVWFVRGWEQLNY